MSKKSKLKRWQFVVDHTGSGTIHQGHLRKYEEAKAAVEKQKADGEKWKADSGRRKADRAVTKEIWRGFRLESKKKKAKEKADKAASRPEQLN